ncbi:gentisate 1,2-dioxygenase [Roseomonas gilardii]|uniref:gentisate 1,2-dioxygenase n=1 Tax=Roseomonas gilardii TaxID=257708 RepID=UPI0004B98EE0|nr:gentisate 1,2-dioxygenase [Roseomonas gilardii]
MQSAGIAGPVAETPQWRAFYERIGHKNLAPLWLSLAELVTPEPRSPCRPASWRFDEIRTAMMEAGQLITAKEAERRVLVLESPGLRGQSRITTSMYAGVQMVLPGEVAPAHRHSQSALRFVLEGSGAYTAVNGERTIMHEGDFIIAPPMAWHDHGNPSGTPIFWFDGLDVPVVQFLDASFAEHLDVDKQPITRPTGDSDARYGTNLLPVNHRGEGGTSPVFNYPYSRTRDALERMRLMESWDPCHGLKMRYTKPITGNHAMATMGTFIQLLPKGFATAAYRSTDATIYVPIEGCGRSVVTGRDGEAFTVDWGKRDIFVVPSWHHVRHDAAGDAVLFSFSDRLIQEALHLFREDRGNA